MNIYTIFLGIAFLSACLIHYILHIHFAMIFLFVNLICLYTLVSTRAMTSGDILYLGRVVGHISRFSRTALLTRALVVDAVLCMYNLLSSAWKQTSFSYTEVWPVAWYTLESSVVLQLATTIFLHPKPHYRFAPVAHIFVLYLHHSQDTTNTTHIFTVHLDRSQSATPLHTPSTTELHIYIPLTVFYI